MLVMFIEGVERVGEGTTEIELCQVQERQTAPSPKGTHWRSDNAGPWVNGKLGLHGDLMPGLTRGERPLLNGGKHTIISRARVVNTGG